VPAADKALCIAAAERTVGIFEPDALEARMGLESWLFFRDLVARGPAVRADLRDGRVGEPSREGRGEFAAEDDADRCGTVGVVEDRFEVAGEEVGGFRSLVPDPRPWLTFPPSD